LKIPEKHVSEIMQLFGHRRDVYAVQLKTADGCIYMPKYESLTEDDIKRHLEGKITLGIYALAEDNTVKWLCFDMDSGHVENTGATCRRITEKCVAQFGAAAVRVEESGSVGNYHIWVFFEKPVQAAYARMLGLKILEGEAKGVELFPKQNALSGRGLGNLVKLPLGFHQKSGRWSKMNLEGVAPCSVNASTTNVEPAAIKFEDREITGGYEGNDPNCIRTIKAGVREGARNNAGIVLASYLMNFRGYGADRTLYLLRLWNRGNKPRLEDRELRSIFKQALLGGYIFGCGHEYLKEYCRKQGCVFENA
jgi:hypothetical protein